MSKITNLIGTTWRLDKDSVRDIPQEYGIFNITCNGNFLANGGSIATISSAFWVGYVQITSSEPTPYPNAVTVFVDEAYDGTETQYNTYVPIIITQDFAYEFTITGGTDISNPLFIDFINTYGTLVSGGEPPTAEGVKSKLQSLITASNAKTGKSDANLTDAVNSLIDGYGQGGGGGIIEVDQLPEVGEVGNVYRCKGKLYLYSNAFSDIIVNMDGQAGSLKEAFGLLGLNTQFNTEETTPTEIPMPPEDVLELYYIKDVDTIYINGDGVLVSFDEALEGAYGEYLGAIADISEATTVGYYALLKPWVEYTNVEGAIDVEENGEYDVSEIATAYVNVPNGVVYGKRRFIDYPNFYRHYIDQVVNFTTIRDGKVAKCSAMGAGPSGTFSEDRIHYTFDDNGSTSVFSLGWYDEESRLIDFGDTPQLVSKEFADFIETSTVKESEQLFEVSTETEMTALLETAEAGSVYKYTGTTGTYENGALYIVEEEAVTLISFTIAGTTYQAEEGMTWQQWCASTYNTAGYKTSTNVTNADGSKEITLTGYTATEYGGVQSSYYPIRSGASYGLQTIGAAGGAG